MFLISPENKFGKKQFCLTLSLFPLAVHIRATEEAEVDAEEVEEGVDVLERLWFLLFLLLPLASRGALLTLSGSSSPRDPHMGDGGLWSCCCCCSCCSCCCCCCGELTMLLLGVGIGLGTSEDEEDGSKTVPNLLGTSNGTSVFVLLTFTFVGGGGTTAAFQGLEMGLKVEEGEGKPNVALEEGGGGFEFW